MEEKKVTVIELFYDLVFVFAVSRIIASINEFSGGAVSGFDLFKYVMIILIFWNIWTLQTFYINWFYTGKVLDKFFLLINMFVISITSFEINIDFTKTFPQFAMSTLVLGIIISIQYGILRHKNKENKEIREVSVFMLMNLGIYIGLTIVALIINNIPLYIFSNFLTAVFPLIFYGKTKKVHVNFAHLSERYTLLTIILFGELIVIVTDLLETDPVSEDFLFYGIVVALFLSYALIMEKGLNIVKEASGLLLAYLHIVILTVLSLIAVDIEHFIDDSVEKTFFMAVLGISLSLYLVALFLILYFYQKKEYLHAVKQLILPAVGLILMLFLVYVTFDNVYSVLVILCAFLYGFVFYFYCLITNKWVLPLINSEKIELVD